MHACNLTNYLFLIIHLVLPLENFVRSSVLQQWIRESKSPLCIFSSF